MTDSSRKGFVPLSPALDPVRAFIRDHIGACSSELIEWLSTGREASPTLEEAARMAEPYLPVGANAIQAVRRLTELEALASVAELEAWREHFPKHTYRRSDGRVLLGTPPTLAS